MATVIYIKKIFPASIAIVTLSLLSCGSSKHGSSKRLPGAFQVSPITIDGYNNDWPSPYPEYDDKAVLGYAVTNDKQNLYITVETGDPATQLKIIKNGLTVWIDKTGNKVEQTAINFPIPDEYKKTKVGEEDRPKGGQWHQGTGGNREDQKRMDLEDRVHRGIDKANEFSLQGFKGCNQQFSLLEKDSCGIVIRMAIDSTNELVWEAVVPLKAFYTKAEMTRADKGKAISVCFETVGSKRPAGEQQGGGSRGGGGGMRPSVGFGMGGGMGMGIGTGGMYRGNHGRGNQGGENNSMMESLYKSTKTWKKFGLAWKD